MILKCGICDFIIGSCEPRNVTATKISICEKCLIGNEEQEEEAKAQLEEFLSVRDR